MFLEFRVDSTLKTCKGINLSQRFRVSDRSVLSIYLMHRAQGRSLIQTLKRIGWIKFGLKFWLTLVASRLCGVNLAGGATLGFVRPLDLILNSDVPYVSTDDLILNVKSWSKLLIVGNCSELRETTLTCVDIGIVDWSSFAEKLSQSYADDHKNTTNVRRDYGSYH